MAARPFARLAARGRDRERQLWNRRHLHSPRRRITNRNLGAQRYADGDGLLRHATAESSLLLRNRGRDLRRRVILHR
ncbi:hypothetical protein D3C71_1304790 [compost metagenome]